MPLQCSGRVPVASSSLPFARNAFPSPLWLCFRSQLTVSHISISMIIYCLVLPGMKSPGQELSPREGQAQASAVGEGTQALLSGVGSAICGSPSLQQGHRTAPSPAGPSQFCSRRQSAGLVPIRCVCSARWATRDARQGPGPRDCPQPRSGEPLTNFSFGWCRGSSRSCAAGLLCGAAAGFRPPGPGRRRGNQCAAGPHCRRSRRAPNRAGREARTHRPHLSRSAATRRRRP